MTQDDLLYRFRLRTFAIAAELGNVRAACRAMGALHNPGCSSGLKPPVSSSDLAM
jgi:hypothetical protein